MIKLIKRDDGDWECPECNMKYRLLPYQEDDAECMCFYAPEMVDIYYAWSTKLLTDLIK